MDFLNFGIRNGTDFQNFGTKYKVQYTFPENWHKVWYISENLYKERVCF